jgi:hypothetical protein
LIFHEILLLAAWQRAYFQLNLQLLFQGFWGFGAPKPQNPCG